MNENFDIEDKTIVCADCGKEFTFTKREQDFYKEKQLSAPKRCKPCRDKKKAQFAKNKDQGNSRY